MKKSIVGVVILSLLGIPFCGILVSGLIGSNTLGWISGITLMFTLPLSILIGMGWLIGMLIVRARNAGDKE